MASKRSTDTMPKMGHVTDLRQQWLVRTDGALAHHLQDREITSHLCENRFRNQQIREDFPVALTEQQLVEQEAHRQAALKQRQADFDAKIAREMAEMSIRERNRKKIHRNIPAVAEQMPSTSHNISPCHESTLIDGVDLNVLGLPWQEVVEMKQRLEQEEKDARLARQLSQSEDVADAALVADVRCAVEAQDSELARALQEKEYHKLMRAKERAKQKARAKKLQKELELQAQLQTNTSSNAVLLDNYSNPHDLLNHKKDNNWLSKSMDSDVNYIEPFEKENIQSKQSALQSRSQKKQWQPNAGRSNNESINRLSTDSLDARIGSGAWANHRTPPAVPLSSRKPRFPEPISIRPASQYPNESFNSYNENNNFPVLSPTESLSSYEMQKDHIRRNDDNGNSKRLSVTSDKTSEELARSKSDSNKKKKSCKIQ